MQPKQLDLCSLSHAQYDSREYERNGNRLPPTVTDSGHHHANQNGAGDGSKNREKQGEQDNHHYQHAPQADLLDSAPGGKGVHYSGALRKGDFAVEYPPTEFRVKCFTERLRFTLAIR